jgi:xylose dehydrogenase (NAD/NADP)
MTIVRWGLLSTARINRRVIAAIRSSNVGKVAGVASRDLDRARRYADEWAIPNAYGSYEALLASGEVDAIYISLPNHLHAGWSISALQAGLHVLCEKPFALTLKDVDAMIEASRTHERVLAEAFMYRHHPQTRAAGEWVQSGRLGTIRLLRGVFNFAIQPEHNIRLIPEYGGGALWDIGVYPVSFAQYLCRSAPTKVSATQQLGKSDVDESFAGLLTYPGGELASISCSFRSPFHTAFEILGSAGRIVMNRPFVGLDSEREMWFYPDEGDPQHIDIPEEELYLGEIEDMHRAILDGAAPSLSLAETRDHVRTALALYRAAREDRVVNLEEVA